MWEWIFNHRMGQWKRWIGLGELHSIWPRHECCLEVNINKPITETVRKNNCFQTQINQNREKFTCVLFFFCGVHGRVRVSEWVLNSQGFFGTCATLIGWYVGDNDGIQPESNSYALRCAECTLYDSLLKFSEVLHIWHIWQICARLNELRIASCNSVKIGLSGHNRITLERTTGVREIEKKNSN